MLKTISIEGMHCAHCAAAVTEALKALDGVADVKVSLEQKQAAVEGNALTDSALREAIEDIGFDVVEIK